MASLTRILRTAVQIPSAHSLGGLIRTSKLCTLVVDDKFLLDDYLQTQKRANEMLHEALASPTRFQSIETREDRTDILPVTYESAGKYITKYRGALMLKNPNELFVYYQLFTHVRPRVVLEMGTYSGASAMWYDDTAKSMDLKCHIYSVDIEPQLLDKELKQRKPDTVNFIVGDTTKIENIFPPSMLEQLPHPWLVVEDSHVNAAAIAQYLSQFMAVGDYLVIEDTSPYIHHKDINKTNVDPVEKATARWRPQKLNMLKEFLKSTAGRSFMVDSFLTDLYGYNCTWHWHGFLRKCS